MIGNNEMLCSLSLKDYSLFLHLHLVTFCINLLIFFPSFVLQLEGETHSRVSAALSFTAEFVSIFFLCITCMLRSCFYLQRYAD